MNRKIRLGQGRLAWAKWAVACAVAASGMLVALGSGCTGAKTQMREFSRMEVGEGPGAALREMIELQKKPARQGTDGPAPQTAEPLKERSQTFVASAPRDIQEKSTPAVAPAANHSPSISTPPPPTGTKKGKSSTRQKVAARKTQQNTKRTSPEKNAALNPSATKRDVSSPATSKEENPRLPILQNLDQVLEETSQPKAAAGKPKETPTIAPPAVPPAVNYPDPKIVLLPPPSGPAEGSAQTVPNKEGAKPTAKETPQPKPVASNAKEIAPSPTLAVSPAVNSTASKTVAGPQAAPAEGSPPAAPERTPRETGKQETAKEEAPDYSGGPRYRIGPEDVLHLSVWGNPELTMDVVVRPDGKISLPLIQDVRAEGLTTSELSAVIHQKLLAYIVDPAVSVMVREVNATKFFVLGYVARPGTYALRGDVSVLQALSLAGGLAQFASPRKIRLVRNVKGTQEVRKINYYDMLDSGEGNYLLMPGDTIVVP